MRSFHVTSKTHSNYDTWLPHRQDISISVDFVIYPIVQPPLKCPFSKTMGINYQMHQTRPRHRSPSAYCRPLPILAVPNKTNLAVHRIFVCHTLIFGIKSKFQLEFSVQSAKRTPMYIYWIPKVSSTEASASRSVTHKRAPYHAHIQVFQEVWNVMANEACRS